MSRYGQYDNVDNIFRQPDELCRSPPSHLRSFDSIGDPLTLYRFYPSSESTSVYTPLIFVDFISDSMAPSY